MIDFVAEEKKRQQRQRDKKSLWNKNIPVPVSCGVFIACSLTGRAERERARAERRELDSHHKRGEDTVELRVQHRGGRRKFGRVVCFYRSGAARRNWTAGKCAKTVRAEEGCSVEG